MKQDDQTASGPALDFGPFRFITGRRALLRAGEAVRLPARAGEILLALVERAGELVSKRELLQRVWPGVIVEQATLRVHIAGLRKILGDSKAGLRFIENVSGLGYRFVAPVKRAVDELTSAAQTVLTGKLHVTSHTLIGREQMLSTLSEQLPQRRLITLTGAGGIGKTAIALAAVRSEDAACFRAVHYIDLASIGDPACVPEHVATSLGLSLEHPAADADIVVDIARFVGLEQTLLLLDNCEHVIDSVAGFVEQLFTLAPELHILATSREPLRARNEWVVKVPPLDLPPPSLRPNVTEALGFAAIELFTLRLTESQSAFVLTDADVPCVADICRKLDGLPLAIELAVVCAAMFGVRGLAANLDDRLKLLTRGHRTAAARHQTLRANWDWSYDTLADEEQTTLQRLAVFDDSFNVESAIAVAADEKIMASDVLDILTSLAAKSLVLSCVIGDRIFFRLLHTSRVYALEKLASSGESSKIRQRHAELNSAASESSSPISSSTRRRYAA